MLKPRVLGQQAKLDRLTAVIRREAESAEADPFDDAMSVALAGAAETLKADAGAIAEFEAQLGKLAPELSRSSK